MNARPVGYNPESAYAGSMSISHDPSQEIDHGIRFTTERLELVPVQYDKKTIEFYHTKLLGNAAVMGKFSSGFVHGRESVEKRVHELAKPWSKGEFGLAFTVRNKETKELVGSAAFDKVRGKEYEFQVLVKETLEDGTPAWNRGIGTEITYAMFQGWAVWLTGKPQGSEGPSFECFNDWEAWDARDTVQMSLLKVTVEQQNYAHRIISRMLEDSKVNKAISKEIQRHDVAQTVFYTTPDEMRSARLGIQIGEEMVMTRFPNKTPDDSFEMSGFLDALHDKSSPAKTPWTFAHDESDEEFSPELDATRKGNRSQLDLSHIVEPDSFDEERLRTPIRTMHGPFSTERDIDLLNYSFPSDLSSVKWPETSFSESSLFFPMSPLMARTKASPSDLSSVKWPETSQLASSPEKDADLLSPLSARTNASQLASSPEKDADHS